MLIEEIKDYLQNGILGWRYKVNVAINPNNRSYYPIAIDYTFNPSNYHLFDYSKSIERLLQTPDKIDIKEVTKIFWQKTNYTTHNLNILTPEHAKSIIKTNEMLITKLNDILIQNTLIDQINNVPVIHL